MLVMLSLVAHACGEAATPGDVILRPASIVFPDTDLGQSARETVELVNRRLDPVEIVSAEFPLSARAEFDLVGVPAAIDGGPGIAEFDVVYRPNVAGLKQTQFTVFANANEETWMLTADVLAASAAETLRVRPGLVDFGRGLVGVTNTSTVEVTNVGIAPVTIVALTSEDELSVFAASLPRQIVVEPGLSAFIPLNFTPEEPGGAEGRLFFVTEPALQPTASVAVRGDGLSGHFLASPSSINVSAVAHVRQTSIIHLRNDWIEPITVTATLTVTREPAQGSVQLEVPDDLTVPPGSEFNVLLHVDADVPGAVEARVDITETSPAFETQTIAVAGSVSALGERLLRVSPATVSFGRVEADTPSETFVWVENTGDRDVTVLAEPTVTALGNPDYFHARGLEAGAVIPARGRRRFDVGFRPTRVGLVPPGVFEIISDGWDVPLEIPCDGIGAVGRIPTPVIDAFHMNFEGIGAGETRIWSVQLDNGGRGGWEVLNAHVEGSPRFQIIGDTDFAVTRGAPVKISVEYFANGPPGTVDAADVVFDSNVPGRPEIRIPISGSIAEPSAPTFLATLQWSSASTDMDLHLVRMPGDMFEASYDLCFCNPSVQWGGPAWLDRDIVRGPGVERASMVDPEDGRYAVFVVNTTGAEASVDVAITLPAAPSVQLLQRLTGRFSWKVGTLVVENSQMSFEVSEVPPAPRMDDRCR